MASIDRRCISCHRVAPKIEFWRVVRVFPEHTVQLDSGMGRSAYLCPCAACLQVAQKKNRLGRSLKAAVPPEIYQKLWHRLSQVDTIEQKAIEQNLNSTLLSQLETS